MTIAAHSAETKDQRTGSPLEVLLVFLKLGVTCFGGPIAHIGYFREEFVVRRRWITDGSVNCQRDGRTPRPKVSTVRLKIAAHQPVSREHQGSTYPPGTELPRISGKRDLARSPVVPDCLKATSQLASSSEES